MVMYNEKKELLKNTVIFGIGTIGIKLIDVLLIPLYTSYMSTADYGTAELLVSTVSLVFPLLTLGIASAIVPFVMCHQENRYIVLKLALIMCVIGTGISGLMVPVFQKTNVFGAFYFFFPIVFALFSLNTVLSQYCKSQEKNIQFAIGGIIVTLSFALLCILLIAFIRIDVYGYIWAYIISLLMGTCFYAFTCRKSMRFKKILISRTLVKDILTFSVPLVPNQLAQWIIQMSDRYMVIFFCGPSLNGIYTMSYKIPSIVSLMDTIFMQAFGITAIKKIASDQPVNGKYNCDSFEGILKKYIAVTFTTTIVVILFTKVLSGIILKKEFFEAWKYTPLILCAYSIGNISSFYSRIFVAIKQTKYELLSTIAGALSNIAINFFMIPLYGAYGAAIATVISCFIAYLLKSVFVSKYLVMRHFRPRILLSFFAVIVAGVLYIRESFLNMIVMYVVALVVILMYLPENVRIIAYCKTAFMDKIKRANR